ncbi:DUF3150 domain-containing protein [Methylicorpusculum oleiharenae]|uniref:DUF3150 domain-containing protein n=1 Tax=Methylicorpusculum oleiharenae TaxID=1338687 RepID=UPI001358F333|nr:DUF3150 domain-containing protein [Methylicorpusculum oleiharenae]MCD2452053.1 DUF3150 domain-containing protein [Methylicorpusculum oleiharenae]
MDQIDVVKLDINLWTSSKKLRPEDLVLADGSKLPPEDLAYLGTKKTIDPDKLKEFNRIKKEAERICLQSGTRFIGGFANPRAEIPRITQELDELSKTFYEARDQLLATYHEDTEEWIARHAEFGDAIRRAIEPVESVASKLRFDYVVFRVTVPQADTLLPDATPAAVDSLHRRTNSMSDQLFHEIAQEASQLIDRSFVGKDTVTGRSLNAFRRMRDKLDSLGFLDHRCMPVVDKIDAVLDALPKQGPYNGIAFNSLFTLGLLLSDPDKIKRHGSGLLQMESISVSDAIAAVESDEEDVDVEMLDSSPAVPVAVAEEPVEAPVADTSAVNTDDDNDLPGFDDFLSNYNPAKDVFDTAPLVDVSINLDNFAQDVFEPALEATSFMASVKETVQVAAETASTSIPVQSKDESETPATEEVVEDFWF